MTSSKLNIKIKELSKFFINELILEESVGDKLPTGSLTYVQNEEDVDLDIELLNISVLLEQEIEYTMTAFVESTHNYKGQTKLDLVFVPKDFIQVPKVARFSGIKALISKLSPFDITGDIKSDCNLDKITLYQNNISDYQMLINYLKCLKKKYLYTFRFNELYFTDLNEPPTSTERIFQFDKTLSMKVSRNKFKDLKVEYEDLGTNGLSNIHYNNSIYLMDRRFNRAYSNMLYNTMFLSTIENKIHFEPPYFMNYRAGEVVKLVNKVYEENNFLIAKSKLTLNTKLIKNEFELLSV